MSLINFVLKTLNFARKVATDVKSLRNTKADIDGLNIPSGTKWMNLRAGGLADYTFNDMNVGSTFENVLVQDGGGIFLSSKAGFQTWLEVPRKYIKTINLTGSQYNQDTWYPVVSTAGMDSQKPSRINVYTTLGNSGVPAWANHGAGFVVDFMLESLGNGWGTTGSNTRLIRNNFNWLKTFVADKLPVGFSEMTNDSFAVIWLRGGGLYIVNTEWNTDWSIKTSAYTSNGQSVSPQFNRILSYNENTVYHGIKNDNISTYSYGDAKIWYEAYLRGDFRDYGLGTLAPSIIGNIDAVKESGFYSIEPSTAGNKPFTYGTLIHINYVGVEFSQIAIQHGSNKMVFRHKDGSGTIYPWVETYSSANFNPNNYIPTAHPSYSITQAQINAWLSYKEYWDNRQIRPSDIAPWKMQFGFGSFGNNNMPAYADYLHFGGYSDSSGGNQNLIMFLKNGFGLRQYQGTLQGVTPYSNFVDYWHTGSLLNPATETYVNAKVAAIPVHNGQLTVNTTTDLVGGYTYLPSGNLSTTLGLATHVLNAIADGQTAYNWGDHNNQNYAKESFRLEAVGSHVTVPIITKKTIIRVDNYGQHFDVEKGNNVGDELAITFCNSQGECVANGNFINDCGNQTTSETFFKNSLFWWDGGNWVQAI